MPRYPRDYFITCNNWTEAEVCAALELFDSARYSVIGFEVGHKTHTPHFHAYAYWTNGKAISKIKTALPRANIQIAKGTAEQCRAYVIKEGEYNEFGDCPKQGSRTDLQRFKDDIMNGMSQEDLIEEHTENMAKYDRFYQRVRCLELKKKSLTMEAPEVIVLVGEPGTGKTRKVYTDNDSSDIYKLEIGDGSSGSLFWDGYDGEPVILIDDFHNNIRLDYMLRLLDRYPMKLNIKGGYTYRVSQKIYITSNLSIDEWYPNCRQIHRDALRRRITQIIEYNLPPKNPIINGVLLEELSC